DDLDILFWRQNPPLDISCAGLLAEANADSGTIPVMLNRPGTMIEADGKTYILNFPDVIPSTRLVDNRAELLDLAGRYPHGVVVKPLSGYGGQGVVKIHPGLIEDDEPAIRLFFPGAAGAIEPPVMVQEYLPQVMQGDVRVLMLNGEPVGAMRRLPAKGDFRTNVSLGGQVLPHHLTSREQDVCLRIGPRLVSDGFVFVGLDLIDGRLIEVNYVSPGGIPRINRLSSLHIETSVVDSLEK
ncbi:MAG: glutathione synthase, partial [Deltaproteobacteria bacterium]|nr:glutathione synthase [Deltaproteobacteria bacterium]